MAIYFFSAVVSTFFFALNGTIFDIFLRSRSIIVWRERAAQKRVGRRQIANCHSRLGGKHSAIPEALFLE